MARVNCSIPEELKARALEELPPHVSFAQVLREGLFARLDAQQAESAPAAKARRPARAAS